MPAWATWKRLIATLCVALVAFVAFESAASADPCQFGQPHLATSAISLAALNDRSPDPAIPEMPVSDHCCSMHTAAFPPVGASNFSLRVSLRAPPPENDAQAPQNLPQGLERPPKTSAAIV